ncbi:hypothetical protein RP20_CCG004845 [Aedes albopictus]|nr:hypothetical protein RP20_CCG004845 [Aedes albopictus]
MEAARCYSQGTELVMAYPLRKRQPSFLPLPGKSMVTAPFDNDARGHHACNQIRKSPQSNFDQTCSQ